METALVENDCEDQGYGLLSDGCTRCPGKPQLIQITRHGGTWWCCPNCLGSYGAVNIENLGPEAPAGVGVIDLAGRSSDSAEASQK